MVEEPAGVAARPSSAPRGWPEDRNAVLAILTEAEDAPAPSPLALDDLPADNDGHGPVELLAVHDLENINLLANGQNLKFAPGLNVVFG
jgi:hypothetical protein